jgi:hypothetical protein
LICPSCQQDAGIVEFCTSANDARPLRHDVWSCECGTAGLGGKQCLCCHEERTWFCTRFPEDMRRMRGDRAGCIAERFQR